MLRSGLKLSLISLFISCISFVNQLVLASFFGASLQMTGYLLGYSVPAVFTGVLTMLLSFSAVPALVRWKESDEYPAVLGAFIATMSVVSGAIALLGVLSSGPLIHRLGANPSAALAADAVLICRVLWINAAASMVSALYIALHNIEHRYAAPLLSSGLPYVGMIVTTVVLGRTWGSRATAIGMLAGTTFSVLWLAVTLRQPVRFVGSSRQWRRAQEFLKDSPLVAFAITSFCAGSAIEAFWAMRLRPEDIAYLGYSQRLVVVLASLVAFGPSAVLMTRLSELAIADDPREFRLLAAKALRMSLFATAPLALMAGIFAGPVVRVLFQRGAFSSSSTAGVASVLPFAMLGSVALCASVMMMKALLARRQLVPAAFIGVMQVASYFVLAGVLSRSFGLRGVISAFALSWWLTLAAIVLALWKSALPELWRSSWVFLGGFCLQLLALAAAMKVAGNFLLRSASSLGTLDLTIRLASCCALGALLFTAVALFVFRSSEMRLLLSTAGSKLKVQELVVDDVHA